MRLSAAQLSALLEGLDWRRVRPAKDTRAPHAARLTCDEVNQGRQNPRKAAGIYGVVADMTRPPTRFPTIPRR